MSSTYIRKLAEQKLGDQAEQWMTSLHPELRWPFSHSTGRGATDTPKSLSESGCPVCIDKVIRLLEEM